MSFKDYNSLSNCNVKSQVKFPINSETNEGLGQYLIHLFGHKQFKDGQFRIIERVLSKKNTLGLLPTGGGKSLCFQLPASLYLGCCVVVCPIKALMRDHQEELGILGFSGRAEIIDGELNVDQKDEVLNKIRTGKCNFVFISPERFQNEEFRNSISTLSKNDLISYLIIDEVHCLSEWGHDFRVSYLALPNTLFNILKLKMPVIGLTATASFQVLTNIKNELLLNDDDVIYKMENRRDELNYSISLMEHNKTIKIKEDEDKYRTLKENINSYMSSDIMKSKYDAGLVFTMHVNGALGCCDLEKTLKTDLPELKIGIYSGQQPKFWVSEDKDDKSKAWDEYKRSIQQKYKNNDLNLMIATKSFGMGINKQNIRFSIHYGMPSSLESLYQEAGRCGRDGAKAENLVIFSDPPEVAIPNYIFDPSTPIEDIQEFRSKHRYVMSDMINQLFFLFNNKKSLEEETQKCIEIINKLKAEVTLYPSEQEKLYRLFQLGIIDDWTIIKFIGMGTDSKVTFGIKFEQISDDKIIKKMAENLLKEIKKYEKSSSEIKKHELKLEEKIKITDTDTAKYEIVKYLVAWSNDTFFHNRLQSLKTLYECCRDFKNTGPEGFKARIDTYFRVDTVSETISKNMDITHDEATKRLDSLLISDENRLIKKEKVDNIIYTVARFLESYKNNPWLDLLSSMCRLITNSFDNADGQARLYLFIKDARELNDNWNETLTGLLDFAQYLNEQEKEKLSNELCHFITLPKDKDELFLIHKYLNDNTSASKYIKDVNRRIYEMI